MKRYYIYLSLISLSLFLGISVLGGYPGHNIKFLVSSVVYCVFTYVVLSRKLEKQEKMYSLLIILLPPTLIYIPAHLINFHDTRLSMLSTLAHFLGIGFGILIYVSRLYLKIALGVLLIFFSVWMAITGDSLWRHKLSFGTYSGKVNFKVTCPIDGIDQSGNHIIAQDLKDKIIVIDFWHTRCGACFKKFPEFQKLYNEYKDNPNISFLAINKPQRSDTIGQAFEMIKKKEYTFQTLIPNDKSFPEKLGVTHYPTIVIIDNQGKAVFRGSVDKAGKAIIELIKNDM